MAQKSVVLDHIVYRRPRTWANAKLSTHFCAPELICPGRYLSAGMGIGVCVCVCLIIEKLSEGLRTWGSTQKV